MFEAWYVLVTVVKMVIVSVMVLILVIHRSIRNQDIRHYVQVGVYFVNFSAGLGLIRSLIAIACLTKIMIPGSWMTMVITIYHWTSSKR